jgi:hypothetical protein
LGLRLASGGLAAPLYRRGGAKLGGIEEKIPVSRQPRHHGIDESAHAQRSITAWLAACGEMP